MTPNPRFHDTFDKTINGVRVLSYGGGSPRFVRVITDKAEINFGIDEARDLHYALERFLADFT